MNDIYEKVQRVAQAIDTKRRQTNSNYNRVVVVESNLKSNDVLEVAIDFSANAFQHPSQGGVQQSNNPETQKYIVQRCVVTAREMAKQYLSEIAAEAQVAFRSVEFSERYWVGPNDRVHGYTSRPFSYRAFFYVDDES